MGYGGIESSLVNLLDNINYDKYDVTLVLEHKRGVFLDKINSKVHVKEYRISDCKFVLLRKIYNFSKRFFWTLINKNKYDFSCCYATYSLMGSKLSKIASSNSSIYIHGDYANMYSKNDLLDFFQKREINKFNSIIFVSNESKNNLLKIFPSLSNKAYVINNFIDNKKIIRLSNENIDIQKKHDILFVFVGRLEEDSKRISRMLKLVNALKSEYSLELWIVGDGPDRKFYENYVSTYKLEDNIKFVGAKKNPYPYMKKADFILLSSEYEGFPVIYLESIVLNKKIITTIDVTDDYISIPNKVGYIVSKDADKFIDDVKNVLKNDKLEYKKIDFESLSKQKKSQLERIFDGVKNEKI